MKVLKTTKSVKSPGEAVEAVKELGISKSTILFKISILKFGNKCPRMKSCQIPLIF